MQEPQAFHHSLLEISLKAPQVSSPVNYWLFASKSELNGLLGSLSDEIAANPI